MRQGAGEEGGQGCERPEGGVLVVLECSVS